jgi:DNA-binding NarL/FixJ family response regulator
MDMEIVPVTDTRTRVLIADDHPGMVEELCRMLAPRCEIVGTAYDGKAALADALESQPDIILLDIEMPVLDGVRVSHEIVRSGIASQIVFVTMHEDADYVGHAFDNGARGYVFKSRLHTDLLTAIEEVLAGRKFTSSHQTAKRLDLV